jgi:hypothetical protein
MGKPKNFNSAYWMKSTQRQNIFFFAPFCTARNNTKIITQSQHRVSQHSTDLHAKLKDVKHVITQIGSLTSS